VPNRRKQLLLDFLPVILLLAVGTVIFRITDWDLAFAQWARANDGTWTDGETGLWNVLYKIGTLPAILTVIAAITILLMGLRSAKWSRFRRPGIYLIFVLALGPGIIANTILKDHWGRPRPRDVAELGGQYRFEDILTIDLASPGKSFPCGHATMGFFFFAGYFLLRSRHRAAAHGFLWFALIYGTLIGVARLIQGGHFASDTLWAAGIIWLVCAALAHALRLDQPFTPPTTFRPVKWPTLFAVGLLLPAVIFGALLATPISHSSNFEATTSQATKISIKAIDGIVIIQPGQNFAVDVAATGHGIPGTAYKPTWNEESATDGRQILEFKQRESGLSTEYLQQVIASYTPQFVQEIQLEMEHGKAIITLPGSQPLQDPPVTIKLELGAETTVEIKLPDTNPPSVNATHNDIVIAGQKDADWTIEFENTPPAGFQLPER